MGLETTVSRLASVTGNAHSRTTSVGPLLAKLRATFKRILPNPSPKVRDHARGGIVLRNLGGTPDLDLRRLYQQHKTDRKTPTTGEIDQDLAQPKRPEDLKQPNVEQPKTLLEPKTVPETPGEQKRTIEDQVRDISLKVTEIGNSLDGLAKLTIDKRSAGTGIAFDDDKQKLMETKAGLVKTIDGAMTSVEGVLNELRKKDPGSSEIPKLDALRLQLAKSSLFVQFPLLQPTFNQIDKTDISAAFKHLAQLCDTVYGNGNDKAILLALNDNIGRFVDAFNAGERMVTLSDGSTEKTFALSDTIDQLVPLLQETYADRPRETAPLVEALLRMRDKVQLGASVDRFSDIMSGVSARADRHKQNTVPDILKSNPKADVKKYDLSLSNLIECYASVIPGLTTEAHSTDPETRVRTTQSLMTIADLASSGDVLPGMLGRSKQMNEMLGEFRIASTMETCEALRKLTKPDPTPEDLKNARAGGKAIAEGHQKLEELDRALRRLLRSNKSAFEGGKILHEGGANSFLKTADYITGLHNLAKGDRHTLPDVAFLLVNAIHLDKQIALLEQKHLALHKGVDLDAIYGRPVGPRHEGKMPQTFDDEPLAFVGIKKVDLERLGFSQKQLEDLNGLAKSLNDKGMLTVKEIEKTTKALNDVMSGVLRNNLSHDAIGTFANDNARTIAQNLLADIIDDAALRTSHKIDVLNAGHVTGIDDAAVTKAFKEDASKVMALLGLDGDIGEHPLVSGSENYTSIRLSLVETMGDRQKIDDKIKDQQQYLLNSPDRKITLGKRTITVKVDPYSPRGLKTAKMIRRAIESHEKANDPGASTFAKFRARCAFKSLQRRLRGFDETTITRPWYRSFVDTNSLRYEDMKKFQTFADAIIYIREEGPRAKQDLNARLELDGKALSGLLNERRAHDPVAFEGVTKLIRTAVLSEWPDAKSRDYVMKDGTIVDGFDPTTKRDAIEERLKGWGLDPKAFVPEIEAVLFGKLDKEEMLRWKQEADLGSEFRKATRTQQRPAPLSRDWFVKKSTMSVETRREFVTYLKNFQDGDKFNLKSGYRAAGDTFKLPVEPSGLAGLRAKLAGTALSQLEIERGGDGYRLHFRTGGEAKAGIEAIVGKKFLNLLSLQASAGLEGALGLLTGRTLLFDEKNLADMVGLIEKMASGQKVTASDWIHAKEVGSSTEKNAKGGMNVKAGAKVEWTVHKSSDGKDKRGIGIGVDLYAGASMSGKKNELRSLWKEQLKSETNYEVNWGATGYAYANISDWLNKNISPGVDTGGKYSSGVSNIELASVGVNATYAFTRKRKQEFDGDDRVTKSEIVRQTSVKKIVESLSIVISDDLRKRLDGSDPKYNSNAYDDFRSGFRNLLEIVRPDDTVAVTYDLPEDKRNLANYYMANAEQIRLNGGDPELAQQQARLANAIVENEANYIPTKVSLLQINVDKRDNNLINLRFVKLSQTAEGKSEHPDLVLEVPK